MKARRIGAICLASLALTSGAFAAKVTPLYLSTTNSHNAVDTYYKLQKASHNDKFRLICTDDNPSESACPDPRQIYIFKKRKQDGDCHWTFSLKPKKNKNNKKIGY